MYLSEHQKKNNFFLNKLSSFLYNYERLATEKLLTIEDYIHYKKSLIKLFGEKRYNIHYLRLIEDKEANKIKKEPEINTFKIPIKYGIEKVSIRFLTELNKFRINNNLTGSDILQIPCNLFSRFLMDFQHQWYHWYNTEICLYTASSIKNIEWDEEVLITLKEKSSSENLFSIN